MVLRMLQGLTEQYSNFVTVMQNKKSLPIFATGRSKLALEETTILERAKQASVLVAHSQTSDDSMNHQNTSQVDGFGSGGRRGRHPQQWQPGSWMQWAPWTCPPSLYPSYNNWARPTFTPPPPQHGLLGPKPQQPAYNANAPSPTDIEAALHTLSLTPPDLSWYMDTGATSHMTSAEGLSDGNGTNEM
ncbi:uncharacterized protein LOC133036244 [Cannabis sativa]|uniref:uncharacterized protein LOC133036244 n=1 Tax=Cannabis sativa TaxID=3483 RepID=UPI0029C9F6C4|nr:uncharacterized protein LOC133036244 [Cannabis sativa]